MSSSGIIVEPDCDEPQLKQNTEMQDENKDLSTYRLPIPTVGIAESQFRRAGIRNELAKFDAVVEKTPMSLVTKLTDMIAHHPEKEPYQKLCSEIVRLVSLSDYQALMQYLDIGESKPSELYQRMKQMLDNEGLDASFFRQMVLQKLPLTSSN